MRHFLAAFAVFVALALSSFAGESVYTLRPDDPSAVYLTREGFNAQADGVADDTAALQAAVEGQRVTLGWRPREGW